MLIYFRKLTFILLTSFCNTSLKKKRNQYLTEPGSEEALTNLFLNLPGLCSSVEITSSHHHSSRQQYRLC